MALHAQSWRARSAGSGVESAPPPADARLAAGGCTRSAVACSTVRPLCSTATISPARAGAKGAAGGSFGWLKSAYQELEAAAPRMQGLTCPAPHELCAEAVEDADVRTDCLLNPGAGVGHPGFSAHPLTAFFLRPSSPWSNCFSISFRAKKVQPELCSLPLIPRLDGIAIHRRCFRHSWALRQAGWISEAMVRNRKFNPLYPPAPGARHFQRPAVVLSRGSKCERV